ncbi:MAG: GTPase HflX [Bacteroidales bacterium]|nr:GTPase HflX [Bacteroidales bacterium]
MLEKREFNAERVVLVGIVNHEQDENKVEEYLDELAFLARTAGASPVKKFTQQLNKPDPKTFIGFGKLSEIKEFNRENKVDTVIFDEELTPSQLRNVEKLMKSKVMDRTNLILDIFARRAKTAHAKTQVELAQYEYLLPRLTGMWTHLERQRGGIGTRGPGEREIETDRRIVRDKITRLKNQLEKIDKQKATQRKNRGKLVRVALVGYTNAGKSTLMNVLSKSEVFEEDKLFATLDTTVRKVAIDNLPFLLTDTVGFIRKLPHSLVESFKSTLDEVREADILLHVVDISHGGFQEQIRVVNQTLQEIGAGHTPTHVVFNKIDLYENGNPDGDTEEADEKIKAYHDLKNSWIAKSNNSNIFISARNKTNIQELRETLYQEVKKIHVQRYPYYDFLY